MGGYLRACLCRSRLRLPQLTWMAPTQIPFDAFVLTNVGEVSYDQIQMYRERVRTVGVSLLGGNSGVEGPYELGIDSIYAVNEEDVPPDAAPSELSGTRISYSV